MRPKRLTVSSTTPRTSASFETSQRNEEGLPACSAAHLGLERPAGAFSPREQNTTVEPAAGEHAHAALADAVAAARHDRDLAVVAHRNGPPRPPGGKRCLRKNNRPAGTARRRDSRIIPRFRRREDDTAPPGSPRPDARLDVRPGGPRGRDGVRAGRPLLDLRLRPDRPAHRGHHRRRRERPLRRLLQPRRHRAPQGAAVHVHADLSRARAASRRRARPARSLDFDSTIFDIVPAVVAGHLGRNDGQADHFAFAFLVPPRHRLGPRLQRRPRERQRAEAPPASAACASASSSTGSAPSWSHRLSDTVSIGVSPFLTYRAQRNRRSLTLEQPSPAPSQAVFVAQGVRVQPRSASSAKLGPRLAAGRPRARR